MYGPLLVIRADASHGGGTGHIMRTLAIAQEWLHRGGRCIYLCASLPEKTRHRLEKEGCEIIMLSNPAASDSEAQESSQILQQLKPHWLIIDSYPLTPSYQSKLTLNSRTKRVNISDFGSSDCYQPNIVIHPNIAITANYSDLDLGTTILAGQNYILIRKEIFKSKPISVIPFTSKLLISMGGSDPLESSYALCSHLIKSDFLSSISVRVICGPAYPEEGLMKTLDHPQIEIISSPVSMKEHYEWADTAVCSPSTTALEIAHYGIPIGLIITADNQENILAAILSHNAGIQLADARDGRPTFLNINELLSSSDRQVMAINAAGLVDGKGAQRICQAMQLPDIYLRNTTALDAEILWEWANDPVTRAASFSSDPIPWEDHLTWLAKQLDSPNVILLIVESEFNKLGMIRFNIDAEASNETIISIGLAPIARGKGLAPLMIRLATDHFFHLHPDQTITAWIKPENQASIQSFIKAEFEDYPSPTQPNQVRLRLANVKNPS